MEREVGGGIRMGNTCKPMAVSFQCMTKFTTNKKIYKNKNKIKIQKKKQTKFSIVERLLTIDCHKNPIMSYNKIISVPNSTYTPT